MIQGLRAECRHGRTTHPPTRELACTHALTQPARTHQVAREIEAQSTSDPETGKALVRELLGDDTEDCACTDLEITLRCVSACVRSRTITRRIHMHMYTRSMCVHMDSCEHARMSRVVVMRIYLCIYIYIYVEMEIDR